MKLRHAWQWRAVVAVGFLVMASSAMSATTIATFDNFTSDALYGSWNLPTVTIESGSNAYTITATGYGSNYKYTPVDGTGNTNVELTVTLSGPPAADGHLGPIIALVDADGTFANYAWYGQLLGSHVLSMPIATPTWISTPGTVPGLDVSTIQHLHLQLDPGGFGSQGAYTVSWEHLRLTGAPPPTITSYSYDPATQAFSLSWTSAYGKLYSVVHSSKPTGPFTPLVTDLFGSGSTNEMVVLVPEGPQGFLRILEQ